jgi:perosamine synthetase
MTNGTTVSAFERAFADRVGASYALALVNGTATLHTALLALDVGDEPVAVPPLTMSATTMAVLQAGARPVFEDVDPRTWLMRPVSGSRIAVSLYGLHAGDCTIDDAAQTLRPHNAGARFTSYSFQASKVLSTGEGGMLTTDDEALAERARAISSLGYQMRADQPRIDPATLKAPDFARHYTFPAFNYRMNDATAALGLARLAEADALLALRREAMALYADAIAGSVAVPQATDGAAHDGWAFAIALPSAEEALTVQEAVVQHGGERPYGAWRLTYQEPAFRALGDPGLCPTAEALQPRLLQFQTNHLASAKKNARALRRALAALGAGR